jgi:polyisoprenyl-teichoic acid--peptidoglycan teichoic acid transferase
VRRDTDYETRIACVRLGYKCRERLVAHGSAPSLGTPGANAIIGLVGMDSHTAPYVAPPPARRRSGWVLRIVFAVVFVLLLVEAGVVLWVMTAAVTGLASPRVPAAAVASSGDRATSPGVSDPAAIVAASEPDVWDQHGPINVLLLGLDTGECGEEINTKATRTDTMILVRVDPRTRRAAMLTIPRDLYAYIGYWADTGREYGSGKINTAHAIGAGAFPDDPSAGPRLLAQTIQRNLDISVHRFVRIDFQGFKKMIDEGLGGLDMDLPPSSGDPTVSLVDSHYPDGKCGTITVEFLPGPQHLDGEHVLQYARSRYSSSDFDRSRRQMEVLMALRAAAKSPSVIPRLPRLIPTVLDTVDTDLSMSEILSLAPVARGLRADDIATFRIDPNIVYDDSVAVGNQHQYVLRLRQAEWDALRAQFLSLSPPLPTSTPPGAVPASTP